MDELVDHCLREIAFDGDLGCTTSRLQEFIDDFWKKSDYGSQSTDDKFLDLVWDALSHHPEVIIGTVPDGAIDVYVAPQKALRKENASKKGDRQGPDTPSSLKPIETVELETSTRSELAARYDNTLRIAIHPAKILSTISGFHTRPNKLSGMVYTCLQLVTRGRETGITLVKIGQKTGYDQKTVFYLVKQLLELDLILKLRRPGVGTHFALHKYFYSQSEVWQQVHETTVGAGIRTNEGNESDEDQEQPDDIANTPIFDPIDARHLTSLQMIRTRVTMLLESVPDKSFPLNRSLVVIGFANPSKTQLRFFKARLRELEGEGMIEIFEGQTTAIRKTMALWIRLRASNEAAAAVEKEVLRQHDEPKLFPIPLNNSLQRLIIESIDRQGTQGATLTDLSKELGSIDRRTIELLITKMDRVPPPPHLRDLTICDVMESQGREHRHRYFTLRHYRTMMEKEGGVDVDKRFADIDTQGVGEFYSDSFTSGFYDRGRDLTRLLNTLERGAPVPADIKGKKRKREDGPPKKRGRPPKRPKLAEEEAGPSTEPMQPVAVGQVEEAHQPVPDPPKRKRGRPRKYPLPTEENLGEETSRAEPSATIPVATPIAQVSVLVPDVPAQEITGPGAAQHVGDETPATPRRRGRPRKYPRIEDTVQEATAKSDGLTVPETTGPAMQIEEDVPIEPFPEAPPPRAPPVVAATGKDASGTKVHNISHLRRRNEFMTLIREADVILDFSSRSFVDAHLALLDKLSKSGEPTSAPPGTAVDKRTTNNTFEQLQAAGLVKVMTATVPGILGYQKPTKIAYDVKYTLQEVNDRLASLGRRVAEDGLEAKPARTKDELDTLYTFQENDPTLICLEKGMSRDMLERERSSFMQEKQSLSQWYGAPSGKIRRAMNLHLRIIQQFSPFKHVQSVVSADPKIVHISFFWTEATLSEYCSFVPTHQYVPGLRQLQKQSSNILVRNVPKEVKLKVGFARSRNKISELLNILGWLGLVVPLEATTENPSIVLQNLGIHPKSYVEKPISEKAVAQFWRILDSVPLISFRDERPARVGSFEIHDNPRSYWDRAQLLAITNMEGQAIPLPATEGSATQLPDLPEALTISMKRGYAWKESYVLSVKQVAFLRGFLSPEGEVLNDALSPEVLEVLEETMFAPTGTISRWLVEHSTHRKDVYSRRILLQPLSLNERDKQSRMELEARKKIQRGLSIRAATAKKQRSSEWEELVRLTYPGVLDSGMQFRLEPIRIKYMNGIVPSSAGQWSHDIMQAISGQVPIPAGLKKTGERHAIVNVSQPIPVSGKSVAELVAELAQNKPLRHPGNKNKEEGGRRQRFQWNKDLDELALDISAIIKSRCRHMSRLEWRAVEQIFMNLPRNSVRQRVSSLRADPALDSYLNRLEDKWHEIWLNDRGTSDLPDDNPDSSTDLNLAAHVSYLRQRIDKNALRAGTGHLERSEFVLPRDVKDIASQYSTTQLPKNPSKWETLWVWSADDAREKALNFEPFLTTDDLDGEEPLHGESTKHIEAALKMVMSTANERYDSQHGAQFLRPFDPDLVNTASTTLLETGVFAKAQPDPEKIQPGRTLKFSEANLNASEGSMSKDIYQDCSSMKKELQNGQAIIWDLVASEGDVACLMELISNNAVTFSFDTSIPASARAGIDWNSKKVDDDELEVSLTVAPREGSLSYPEVKLSNPVVFLGEREDQMQIDDPAGHQHDGADKFCGLQSKGLVNCSPCLDASLDQLLEASGPQKGTLLKSLLEQINAKDAAGVPAEELKSICMNCESIADSVESLQELISATPPLVIRVGYNDLFVISAKYITSWGVAVRDGDEADLILPRRWVDITGHVADGWRLATTAVLSSIFMRPGITLHDLKHRLRLIYERQEIEEVLDELQSKGVIRVVTCKEHPAIPDWILNPSNRSLIADPSPMWDFVY